MTDEQENLEEQKKSFVGTTTDIQREAEEALRLYNMLQENTATQARRKSSTLGEGVVLVVEIMGSSTAIYVKPEAEMVIGRRDPATDEAPAIDLSPHAAYQMGVSRKHVILRVMNDQLYLYDLGSRNGTYLNAKKTIPNQPYRVYDGDELRLGKMTLRLHFREKAE